MWDLSKPINDFDLINRVYGWGQASMHAEYLVVDHDAESQEIKHIREIVPDVGTAVLAGAFSVETVRLGDAARFMISADKVDALGVSEFEADEEGYRFYAKQATVDVVAFENLTPLAKKYHRIRGTRNSTQEQIVCVGAGSANLENFNQIVELAVDIAHHSDGSSNVDDIAFAHQKLFGFGAYRLYN